MNIINGKKAYNFKLCTENIEQSDETFSKNKQMYFITGGLDSVFEDLETDSGAEHVPENRTAWITFYKDRKRSTITFLHATGCFNLPYSETFDVGISDSEIEAFVY